MTTRVKPARWTLGLSIALLASVFGCAGAAGQPAETSVSPGQATYPGQGVAPSVAYPNPESWARGRESALFADALKRLGDVDFAQVTAAAGPRAPARPTLGFDPAKARYYDQVAAALAMTPEELNKLRDLGFVSLARPPYRSMGGMYFEIYTRDLPVLVTTDSILEALHRSFDTSLESLELTFLSPAIHAVLRAMHEQLGAEAAHADPALRDSLRDIDLYLTVARNLLEGSGAAADGATGHGAEPAWNGNLQTRSKLAVDDDALRILKWIAAQQSVDGVPLYGSARTIDFSQFRPRGHYDHSTELRRYFRAMMWLGRSDLGFRLPATDPSANRPADLPREALDASVLTTLIRTSGQQQRLQGMSGLIDFLVGRADSASPPELEAVLTELGAGSLANLANPQVRSSLVAHLASRGLGAQQIHSEITPAAPGPARTPTQPVFQMFGQRFVLDSFVLANVVYDHIVYKGEEVHRYMPAGLDVMAALGNREAVALLEPELSQFHYGANLLAARAVVDSYRQGDWAENTYSVWLDTLRSLNSPPASGHVPRAMTSQAWQQKQLQTQLASWAELRHDTILYAKQSYSMLACEYPAGYVEPYPDFYAKVGHVATELARRLQAAPLPQGDAPNTNAQPERDRMVAFYQGFAGTIGRLEQLARKELAATPFTDDEKAFLKKTIDIRGGGSGPPTYDGWYPMLFWDRTPDRFEPTVADVHTDPNSGQVLEVAVGNTNMLVLAVDNEQEQAVYVGPSYTYYEFRSPVRLTDSEWLQRLPPGKTPPRPDWVGAWSSSVGQSLESNRSAPPAAPPNTSAPPSGKAPPGGRPPRPTRPR